MVYGTVKLSMILPCSEKQKRTVLSTGDSTVLGRKDLQVSDLNHILVHVVNQLTNISSKSIRTTG